MGLELVVARLNVSTGALGLSRLYNLAQGIKRFQTWVVPIWIAIWSAVTCHRFGRLRPVAAWQS